MRCWCPIVMGWALLAQPTHALAPGERADSEIEALAKVVLVGVSREALEGLEVQSFDGLSTKRLPNSLGQHGDKLILSYPRNCGGSESYVVKTSTLVSAPLPIEGCGDDSAAPPLVELFPAGRIHGKLLASGRPIMPASGLVELTKCTSKAMVAETDYLGRFPAVSLPSTGGWTALVPAGCHHVDLLLRGWARSAWKNVPIEYDSDKSLGVRNLEPESRLLVNVYATDGPVDEAHVFVIPESAVASALEQVSTDYAGRWRQSSLTDQNGVTSIQNIAKGTYRAVVLKEAFAFGVSPPFTIESKEAVAQTVRLERPGSIEVAVSLGPEPSLFASQLTVLLTSTYAAGRPTLTLSRKLPRNSDVARFGRIPPGDWKVQVASYRSDTERSVLAEQEFDLAPQAHKRLVLTVEAKPFRGTVLFREQPVEAWLRFVPLDPMAGDSVVFGTSNPDGSFETFLPHEGRYKVDIRSRNPELIASLREVFFSETEGNQLEIPDQSIVGFVDGDFGAEPDARIVGVLLRDPRKSLPAVIASARSDANGRFSLDGLGPGLWQLRAAKNGKLSAVELVDLEPKQTSANVSLTLENPVVVSGALQGPQGPIADARIDIAASTGLEIGGLVTIETRSESDGTFQVDLPPGLNESINVEVDAKGFPLQAFRRTLDGPSLLRLRAGGAIVRLYSDGIEWRGLAMPDLSLVGNDGNFIRLIKSSNVETLGSLNAPEPHWDLLIRSLAPGRWRLVNLTPARIERLLVEKENALEELVEFTVASGETEDVYVSPPLK